MLGGQVRLNGVVRGARGCMFATEYSRVWKQVSLLYERLTTARRCMWRAIQPWATPLSSEHSHSRLYIVCGMPYLHFVVRVSLLPRQKDCTCLSLLSTPVTCLSRVAYG